MNRFPHSNLVISLLFAAAFIMVQFLPSPPTELGGACVTTLEGPDPEAHAYIEIVHFGLPLSFLEIKSEGCFEARVHQRSFRPLNLLGDIGFLAIGTVLSHFAVRAMSRRVSGAD